MMTSNKHRFALIGLLALTACAQLPGQDPLQALGHQLNQQLSTALGLRPTGTLVTYTVPLDALQARDAQLRDNLVKTGQLASKQTWPMTIRIAGTQADIAWMRDAIAAGITRERLPQIQFIGALMAESPAGDIITVTYTPVQP